MWRWAQTPCKGLMNSLSTEVTQAVWEDAKGGSWLTEANCYSSSTLMNSVPHTGTAAFRSVIASLEHSRSAAAERKVEWQRKRAGVRAVSAGNTGGFMHGLLFMPFKCINKLMELNMVCYYHGSVNKRKAERRCLSTLKTFFSLLAVNQTDSPLPSPAYYRLLYKYTVSMYTSCTDLQKYRVSRSLK